MPRFARTVLLWIWAVLVPITAFAQTSVRTPKAVNQGVLAWICLAFVLSTVVLWVLASRYRERRTGT